MRNFNFPSVDSLHTVECMDYEYSDNLIEIEGVVSPESQGGWCHPDGYDVHAFIFSAWRIPGKEVVRSELLVLRPVVPETDFFDDFPKLAIKRISVLMSTDKRRAVYHQESEIAPTQEGLVEVIQELQAPVFRSTELLGTLELDRRTASYIGQISWRGSEVKIVVLPGEDDDLSCQLATLEELYKEQVAWSTRIEQFSVDKLLKAKNECWLQDGEKPLSSTQFWDALSLETIHVSPNGLVAFWYDDGDLFGGHMLEISFTIEEGAFQGQIAG